MSSPQDRRSSSPPGSFSLPGLASFDFPPPAFSSSHDRRPSSVLTGVSSANSSPLPSPCLLPSWSQGSEADDQHRGVSPTSSSSLWSKPLHRVPARSPEDPFASFSFAGTVSTPAPPGTGSEAAAPVALGYPLPSVGHIITGGRASLQGGSFASRQSAIRSSFSGERYRRSASNSPPPTPGSSTFAYPSSNMSTPPYTPASLASSSQSPPTFSYPPNQHRHSRSIPYSPPASDPTHLGAHPRPPFKNRGHSDPLSSPGPKLASIHTLLHGSSPPSPASTPLPRGSYSAHPYERPATAHSVSPQAASRPNSSGHHQQQQQPNAAASSSSNSRAPIQRTTRACDNCRSRKTRCLESEGGEGTCCARCKELMLDCVWSGGGKKRGPVAGMSRSTSSHRSEQIASRRASVATASTPSGPPPSYFPPGARDLASTSDQTLSFQSYAPPTPTSPSVFAQPHQYPSQQTPAPTSPLKRDRSAEGQMEEGSCRLPGLSVMFGERSGVRLY